MWKKIDIWKTIAEFPLYEINEFGVVRNAKTHYVTTQRMNEHGYLYVQLKDGERNNTWTTLMNAAFTIRLIIWNGSLTKITPIMEPEMSALCVNERYLSLRLIHTEIHACVIHPDTMPAVIWVSLNMLCVPQWRTIINAKNYFGVRHSRTNLHKMNTIIILNGLN